MSTNRRRMLLKPLSPVTLLCKEKNSNAENNGIQSKPPATLLVSPTTDKKKILLQEFVLPEVPSAQQNNKVLLSYSGNKDLSDSDDSDSDNFMIDGSTKKSQKSNKKLYYIIFGFSCWAAVQYWMIAVAGFGAVFFGISALIAICLNTTSDKKRTGLSAYSVFNPQCSSIQGSADPKQLERELIFGGL